MVDRNHGLKNLDVQGIALSTTLCKVCQIKHTKPTQTHMNICRQILKNKVKEYARCIILVIYYCVNHLQIVA
jgi:hypothetical protein